MIDFRISLIFLGKWFLISETRISFLWRSSMSSFSVFSVSHFMNPGSFLFARSYAFAGFMNRASRISFSYSLRDSLV